MCGWRVSPTPWGFHFHMIFASIGRLFFQEGGPWRVLLHNSRLHFLHPLSSFGSGEHLWTKCSTPHPKQYHSRWGAPVLVTAWLVPIWFVWLVWCVCCVCPALYGVSIFIEAFLSFEGSSFEKANSNEFSSIINSKLPTNCVWLPRVGTLYVVSNAIS